MSDFALDNLAADLANSDRPSVPDKGLNEQAEVPRFKRIAKTLLWVAWGVFWLVAFTIAKLPEERLQNFVQGSISDFLAPKGISFRAKKAYLSYWGGGGGGPSYTLEGVELEFPPPNPPVTVDKIVVWPKILPLFLGRLGGGISMTQGQGALNVSATVSKGLLDATYEATHLDLGKTGVLPILAGLQGSALLDGQGTVHGDTNRPNTLGGHIKLNLKNMVLDAQTVSGFSLPKITVSDGQGDFAIDQGKVEIKALSLGHPGNATDALVATVTGVATLANPINMTSVNVRANINFSEGVHQAFPLLDALLANSKMPDGSYAMVITGILQAPNFSSQSPPAK